MAKRLRMTSADYVAIAISPALIMTLVGSLIFFLIAVFYEGEYQLRLTYAFGWFVFAAVLIARIAIEMGSERAAMFALPLAGAMYLFLVKFVEHPSPFSHLINLALMAAVWWCAHRLTWDSTVIDDDEDASGEGLMQRIGVDGPEAGGAEKKPPQLAGIGASENELLESADGDGSVGWKKLRRFVWPGKGRHTPGQSILYFSLAALPLFGMGQYWIPATDTWRRRYAFILLLVYVASALSLLVTTSFLNLRRYLRQRHVEMPLPIAGTWVGVGGVLIVIVMLLAMVIPRPAAEVALSRPPWQVSSPGGLSASRLAFNRDGGEQQDGEQDATAGERTAEEGQAEIDKIGGRLDPNSNAEGRKESDSGKQGKSGSQDGKGESSAKQGKDQNDSPSDGSQQQGKGTPGKRNQSDQQDKGKSRSQSKAGTRNGQQEKTSGKKNSDEKNDSPQQPRDTRKLATPSPSSHLANPIQNIASSLGGLAGVLKVLLYAALAIILAVLIWKYREQILRAIADIIRAIRELFGGGRSNLAVDPGGVAAAVRPKSFGEFQDPFLTGQHARLAPEELVRYTFAAFEAWAYDRGRPRSPDCTPQELIGSAVDPESPIYAQARQLVRMYGEVAYASRRVSPEAAGRLREIWQLMRETHAIAPAAAVEA